MHTGTPEYRAYKHQGAVKNCLALRQVPPKYLQWQDFSGLSFYLLFLYQFTAYHAASRIVSLSLFSFKQLWQPPLRSPPFSNYCPARRLLRDPLPLLSPF